MTNTILSSIAVILLVTLILVALLLFVKAKITPKGKVKIDIKFDAFARNRYNGEQYKNIWGDGDE